MPEYSVILSAIQVDMTGKCIENGNIRVVKKGLKNFLFKEAQIIYILTRKNLLKMNQITAQFD